MKKRIVRYLKHTFLTFFIVVPIIFLIVLTSLGGNVHYNDNPKRMDWDQEGPYAFYENDSTLNVNYVRGNKKDGFHVEKQEYGIDEVVLANCHFGLDSSTFNLKLESNFEPEPTVYFDKNKILAISDLESGYKTFRDFLINNKVIDQNLDWTFGKGHLVLVGDFVDRGFSTTQVLWFIYKLEKDAEQHGGQVHFIIGNHELKNMQGNFDSASPKYFHIAAILGRKPYELYAPHSFMGKWMASKNSIEKIDGHLFAHGGLHPDLIETTIDLDSMNQILRRNYFKASFPRGKKDTEELLVSTRTGISWYRGFFKDDLSQDQIDQILKRFEAKSVVVGHTIQSKVNRQYNGKVIGIDVRHPKDYSKSWPDQKSEGLLIEGDRFFRVFADGRRKEI